MAAIAEMQRLIDRDKIGTAHALSRHPECSFSFTWISELVARKLLKLTPGVPPKTPPRTKFVPVFLKELQDLLDSGMVTSLYGLANHPAIVGRVTTGGLQLAVKQGLLKVPPKPTIESRLVTSLLEKFSPADLKLLATTGKIRVIPGGDPVPIVHFNGERVRIGGITDTHFGSRWTKDSLWEKTVKELNAAKCDIFVHTGDVTDGHGKQGPGKANSGELVALGFQNQLEYSVKRLSMLDSKVPFKVISGNHDRWYTKDVGADIVKAIVNALKEKGHDAQKIGDDWGDVSLAGKATLRLWHGEDGNSYAVSYRIQKVVEAMSGGSKPNVLMAGHTHKSMYILDRNVHCYSLGSIQLQTSWMMGKRIAAHAGFWIVDLLVNSQGVSRATGTFYPFYE